MRVGVAAAIALAILAATPASASPLVEQRRAAIVALVRAWGVYPGAEIPIAGNVYLVEAVTVSADYVLTVRTRLIRSND